MWPATLSGCAMPRRIQPVRGRLSSGTSASRASSWVRVTRASLASGEGRFDRLLLALAGLGGEQRRLEVLHRVVADAVDALVLAGAVEGVERLADRRRPDRVVQGDEARQHRVRVLRAGRGLL